jgi:hypothetical protein
MEVVQSFRATFCHLKVCKYVHINIGKKLGWAKFWVIFSQTYLVTLVSIRELHRIASVSISVPFVADH